MRTSKAGIDLIKQCEGLELAAYPDPATGAAAQLSAPANGNPGSTYGGGGGGGNSNGTNFGSTGSGGGFTEKVYVYGDLTIGATIAYAVGGGGAAGTANTVSGGAGANGGIVIEWDY